MVTRRTILGGIGAVVVGGGALVGTGAFTTVQAERTVSVETAGDADAFLALSPASGPNGAYADGSGDTIEIVLDGSSGAGGDGLNQNAITAIRNIVEVANNGTQDVESLTLEFTTTPSGVDPDDTFAFLVDDGNDQDQVDNGEDILTGNNGVSDTLGTGDAINFGLEVDLIDGGDDNDLPDNGSYALSITAETSS